MTAPEWGDPMSLNPRLHVNDVQRAAAVLSHFVSQNQAGYALGLQDAQDQGRLLELVECLISVISRIVPEVYDRGEELVQMAATYAGLQR